jgi:hypothetical protein
MPMLFVLTRTGLWPTDNAALTGGKENSMKGLTPAGYVALAIIAFWVAVAALCLI